MNFFLYSEPPDTSVVEISNISTASIKNGLKVATEIKFLVSSSAVADLMVMQSPNKSAIYLGENLIYAIVVTNKGPSNATEVTLNDTLPEDANLVSVVLQQGTYEHNNNQINCNLGSLSPGKNTTITITLNPTISNSYKNTATVTAKEYDPNLNNNTAIATAIAKPSKPKYRGIEFF